MYPSIAPSGIETIFALFALRFSPRLQSHLRVLKLYPNGFGGADLRTLQSHLRVLKQPTWVSKIVSFGPSIAPSGIETIHSHNRYRCTTIPSIVPSGIETFLLLPTPFA